MTIPKSIREKAGLRIGDLLEVTTDETGRVTAKRLGAESVLSLELGGEFGRKHGISEADVVRLSRRTRREVFKEEYE
jgi:AbrB family looped-hinge helix DNA binding protein